MALNQQRPGGAGVDCQRIEQEETIEQYLAGKLAEAEAEAFEQHYLGCQSCFEELQFRHAAAIELKRQSRGSSRLAAGTWQSRRTWALAAAAVLMLMLASVTIFNRWPSSEVVQQSPPYRESREEIIVRLAVVEGAPPYAPFTMRGGQTKPATERFQEGMQRYLERNYAGAIPFLEEAVRLNPKLQPALFYLGISRLMIDQPDGAITSLSKLTQTESSPYLEEARWFLAKAFFKKRDLASAQKELEAVVTLNGPHLQEARQALEVVRSIAKERPSGATAQ